tara:strand:+ start:216 stop:869 length:654 start_codon:yes stop_codon:yes gene_type:complete
MKNEIYLRIISSIILLPASLFLIIKGSFYFNLLIFTCFIIALYEWNKMCKNRIYFYFGLIFLLFSFYTVYFTRTKFNDEYIYFILVLLICIFTDIGGYIIGKIFKGPKLTKISPNKTYSGMIGGYFLSTTILILFIFDYVSQSFASLDLMINEFFFIIIISTVSQTGDIIISYFKRLSQIKDTGNIIPGHGGLLDRIDGMIFAFPAFYIIYFASGIF